MRPIGGAAFTRELEQQTRPGLQRFERQLNQSERTFGRFARGSLIGTGALHSFGRAAVFASSTLLGGYGLTFALRASVDAARDAQVVQANLENAVRSSGIAYRLYRGEINATLKATNALGFTTDETGRSYATLIRATGDVAKANRDQALAANIARATNRSLEVATRAVAQAEAGRAGALQRLVPGIEKGAKAQKALGDATRITAGAAAKYGDTFAGSQARLNAAISETEVTIGNALLPTVKRLSNQLADWLDKSENQKRIQQDVNKLLHAGGIAAHDLGDGLKFVKSVADPLIETVGGLEKAVKLLLLAMAVSKVRAFAGALGLVGPAAIKAGAGIAAGEAEIAAASKAGLLARLFGGGGSALGPLGLAVGGGYALGQIFDKNKYSEQDLYRTAGRGGPAGQLAQQVIAKSGLPGVLRFADVLPALQANTLSVAAVQTLKVRFATDDDYNAALAYARQNARASGAAAGAVERAIKPIARFGGALGATGLAALTPRDRNALARSAAIGSPGTADDLRALTEQRRLLGQAIAVETGRLQNAVNAKQARKFADNLQTLQDQDNAALAQIQQIQAQAAQDARDKAAKIKAAAEKARRAREQAIRDTATTVQVGFQDITRGVVLGIDIVELAKAREKAAKAAAAPKALALDIQENALTLARQVADLAVARAGTNQALLDKATELERKADRRLIKFYADQERNAKTRLDRQAAAQKKIAAQIDLVGLKKPTAASGYTLQELFAEAGSELAQYGGNVGGPLSSQDARASFAGAVKTQQTTVVQNFYGERNAGQGLADAYRVARNMK